MSASTIGINFRGSLAFVTDGTDEVQTDGFSGGNAYPVTKGGWVQGWTVTFENAADRNASIDRRLAGIGYKTNTGLSQGTYRVDLPAAGSYTIRLALGDDGSAQSYQYCEILDNTTSKLIIDKNTGTAVDEWYDAAGTKQTLANWPGSNAAATLTFATTTLFLKLGTPTAQAAISTLSHLFISQITTPTAALTGTATASITEADVVAGGKTIILTLTGDTWIPA